MGRRSGGQGHLQEGGVLMSRPRISVAVLLILILGAMVIVNGQVASQQSRPTPNRVLEYNARVALGQQAPVAKRQAVSGGVLQTYLEISGRLPAGVSTSSLITSVSRPVTEGCQNTFVGASGTFLNVRVNQDCSLRRQAEEVIAINPTDSRNLIVGGNDSRIGFNHCGYAWSFDRGKKWGDMVPPFWQFLMLDGHTADACSDPTATFDALGNAYVGGVFFDVAAAASAFLVVKSNAGIGGAFYHTPNSALSFQTYRTNPPGVVANDNNPDVFHDKEFIVADSTPGSPKANRVYATWTRFNFATGAGVGGHSPIYFSQSTDGGATWSAGIAISGANAAICTVFSGSANPNACDQDQGSHPIVGPDGTVYVVFGNGNTPLLGINQFLFTKCPVAADCTNSANWTPPTKVGDLIGTHPTATGANAAGCPVGRQCLPPNGYRAPEFTGMSISADPTNLSRLFVVWWDTRNLAANCTGDFSTATPPCDTDVFLSISSNGGATWGAPINISNAAGNDNNTVQWQSWSAVGPNGTLFIAYYDRKYGSCETTGCSDITLVKRVPNGTLTYFRITTASMPNLVVANNPLQAGFLGDYMWVAVDSGNIAHIVWADTRGRGGTVEEDLYYARTNLTAR